MRTTAPSIAQSPTGRPNAVTARYTPEAGLAEHGLEAQAHVLGAAHELTRYEAVDYARDQAVLEAWQWAKRLAEHGTTAQARAYGLRIARLLARAVGEDRAADEAERAARGHVDAARAEGRTVCAGLEALRLAAFARSAA